MDRLLEPGDIAFLIMAGAADGFVDHKTLVRIGHDVKVVADGLAHRAQAANIFRHVRAAYLDLGATEAALPGLPRFLSQFALVDVEPAALGVVELDAVLGASGCLMERQLRAL